MSLLFIVCAISVLSSAYAKYRPTTIAPACCHMVSVNYSPSNCNNFKICSNHTVSYVSALVLFWKETFTSWRMKQIITLCNYSIDLAVTLGRYVFHQIHQMQTASLCPWPRIYSREDSQNLDGLQLQPTVCPPQWNGTLR
uniref:UORF2 n=1 Tax=Simian cytomegalovirus TaxID=10364 RepID=Q98678_SCMVC|nr:UORF2 [Simian cytomegalovirus]